MVKNIFSILYSRQTNILSGASILMVAVFASKCLGLIRDRLLVHTFNSTEASIFLASFRLPELLFNILIFGALSVAFIPVFTEALNKDGEKEAFHFANDILNLALILFTSITILAFIFVKPLNSLLLPGFTGEIKLATDALTRTVLLGQIILVVGTFFVGISQSYQRFIVPAFASLTYHLGVIIGLAFLSPIFGISGAALGVVIGAALHVLIQLPVVTSLGYRYSFSFDLLNSGVKEVIRLMSFRNIALVIEQVNETVSIALASLVSTSSLTLLTFAQHMHAVPIGLFGATIAQAALPVLSKEYAQKDMSSFKITLLTTMHQILFLTLPSAAILVVLRIPIVRLVFGASQFTWNDTVLTGRTLAFLSVGLIAQAVLLLLVRGFYAIKDTKSPVILSVVTVLINVALSLLFIQVLKLDVWSLGLSYSISSLVSVSLMLYLLHRKINGLPWDLVFYPAIKMLIASLISAVALYIPLKALDQLVFDTTKSVNLFILTGIASLIGLSIYILFVWWFRVRELYVFGNMIKKIYSMQFKVESAEIVKETSSV